MRRCEPRQLKYVYLHTDVPTTADEDLYRAQVLRSPLVNTNLQETDGLWKLDGPSEILVSRQSASKPMDDTSSGIRLDVMQMNQNHADMVKFTSAHDHKYQSFVLRLKSFGFWKDAVASVQARFGPEGWFASDPYINHCG